MRNFKCLGHLASLIRSKPINPLLTVREYSYYFVCNYAPAHSVEKSIVVFKNRNRSVYQKELSCRILLSKNIFSSSMCYAKSKDRGGDRKKSKATKVDLHELNEVFDGDELIKDMNKAIEAMKLDFIQNLSLRSTTGALEQIPVKVDGKEYQIQELAQIARKPKTIVLNVSAFPTTIPHIIKAIEKSGLNINPQQDGTTLFLPIPKVTKEHRENLSKNAKAIFIRHRDVIKDIKVKAIKTVKNKKAISQDTINRAVNKIDALSANYIKEAEVVLESKQNELFGSSY